MRESGEQVYCHDGKEAVMDDEKDKSPQNLASAFFVRKLREKVKFLAEECWPRNLRLYLNELNEILKAGRELGATSARPFTDEEVETLMKALSPFRTLDMQESAREILVKNLLAAGVDQADLTSLKLE